MGTYDSRLGQLTQTRNGQGMTTSFYKRLETNRRRTGEVIQAIAIRIHLTNTKLWLSSAKAQARAPLAIAARGANCAARACSYAIERGVRAGFALGSLQASTSGGALCGGKQREAYSREQREAYIHRGVVQIFT